MCLQVLVKRRGSAKKHLATVIARGAACDIAMLEVQAEEFWRGLRPLDLQEGLPLLRDTVYVIGYPIGTGLAYCECTCTNWDSGGETLSVTSGVVSRIEVMTYVHGGWYDLRLLA